MCRPVALWLLLLFSGYACRGPVQKKGEGTDLQKITIYPDQVFDLSGYAGNGGGNPFHLFDENAYVDPRYEKSGDVFLPVTNCQPTLNPSIYFRGKEGSRVVVDLKIFYDLREIYYYDRSHSADRAPPRQ